MAKRPITPTKESTAATGGSGWLHNLAKPGVEIYAGYHHLDNEASAAGIANLGLAAGTSLEDADFFVVGSRIKFK